MAGELQVNNPPLESRSLDAPSGTRYVGQGCFPYLNTA